MEKRFENKLIMLKAVLSLLQQNQSLWQTNAPMNAAYNDLRSHIAQIEQAKQNISLTQAGLAIQKQNLQDAVVDATFELASMLFAFAQRTNNTILQAKVDFPISQLKLLRDGELATTSRNILTLRQGNEGPLVEYGVTDEKANTLTNLINRYEQELPNIRVTVSERKAINENLKTLLNEAMDIASKQIDRLMIGLKTTQPGLYASYTNARKVVDYGTRYEKTDETEEKQTDTVK